MDAAWRRLLLVRVPGGFSCFLEFRLIKNGPEPTFSKRSIKMTGLSTGDRS